MIKSREEGLHRMERLRKSRMEAYAHRHLSSKELGRFLKRHISSKTAFVFDLSAFQNPTSRFYEDIERMVWDELVSLKIGTTIGRLIELGYLRESRSNGAHGEMVLRYCAKHWRHSDRIIIKEEDLFSKYLVRQARYAFDEHNFIVVPQSLGLVVAMDNSDKNKEKRKTAFKLIKSVNGLKGREL